MIVTMTAEIRDAELTVDYSYYKGCKGARDSLNGVRGAGAQLEPDEPPSVEILSVKLFGEEVELTEQSQIELEEMVMKQIREDRESEP